MAKSTVEFDFFRLEKESSSKNQSQKKLDRRISIRDMQTAISKINPTILRSVMASGYSTNSQDEITANASHTFPSQNAFPLFSPPKKEEKSLQTSIPKPIDSAQTMTIFYNGSVSVFHVPQEKADDILKLAVEGKWSGSSSSGSSSHLEMVTPSVNTTNSLVESLEGDLPIARRKSLQRFLEKRRERLDLTFNFFARGCWLVGDQKSSFLKKTCFLFQSLG